jgi:hypothetical protein
MKEVGPWHAWKVLSNQVNIKCFYAKSTRLGSNYRNISSLTLIQKSFQGICRGLWIIIAELTCGLFPMMFRMVFPSCKLFMHKKMSSFLLPVLKLMNLVAKSGLKRF